MRKATITRQFTSDMGTEGRIICPEVGFALFTLELPWRNNRPNISCIPAGVYVCKLYRSPRFGLVYQVMDVAGRTYILHHSGNLAGDTTKGYRTNVQGCILHGLKRGWLHGQRAVLSSRPALRRLWEAFGGHEFELTIEWEEYEKCL